MTLPPDSTSRTPAPGGLPAAASLSVRPTLLGPPVPARVLAAFPAAVYLRTADGEVLALLTRDAVRLPNGLVLPSHSTSAPFEELVRRVAEVGAGTIPAHCGGGVVRVGPLLCHTVRWWAPLRPRPPGDPLRWRASVHALGRGLRASRASGGPASGLPAEGRAALRALAARAARQDSDGCAKQALRLVGLGPGLTPSGDDVLCGFLLALRHLGGRPLAAPVHHAGRTTQLSAALLDHAARGDGCDPLVRLLDAVAGHTSVPAALAVLLAVGHTSGADLALGVLAGAHAVLARGSETPQWKESV